MVVGAAGTRPLTTGEVPTNSWTMGNGRPPTNEESSLSELASTVVASASRHRRRSRPAGAASPTGCPSSRRVRNAEPSARHMTPATARFCPSATNISGSENVVTWSARSVTRQTLANGLPAISRCWKTSPMPNTVFSITSPGGLTRLRISMRCHGQARP